MNNTFYIVVLSGLEKCIGFKIKLREECISRFAKEDHWFYTIFRRVLNFDLCLFFIRVSVNIPVSKWNWDNE